MTDSGWGLIMALAVSMTVWACLVTIEFHLNDDAPNRDRESTASVTP